MATRLLSNPPAPIPLSSRAGRITQDEALRLVPLARVQAGLSRAAVDLLYQLIASTPAEHWMSPLARPAIVLPPAYVRHSLHRDAQSQLGAFEELERRDLIRLEWLEAPSGQGWAAVLDLTPLVGQAATLLTVEVRAADVRRRFAELGNEVIRLHREIEQVYEAVPGGALGEDGCLRTWLDWQRLLRAADRAVDGLAIRINVSADLQQVDADLTPIEAARDTLAGLHARASALAEAAPAPAPTTSDQGGP